MNPKPLERKIEIQKQEIARLEAELIEKKAFLQGMLEAMKMFPKSASGETKGETVLRPGSDMAKARDFLAKHGRPAHILEILEGIGKDNSKLNRLSLSSSLAGYARKNDIFEKTAPNTFTLIGLLAEESDSDAPPHFGEYEDEMDGEVEEYDPPF